MTTERYLTPIEWIATDLVDHLLDHGMGLASAVAIANIEIPGLSEDFLIWEAGTTNWRSFVQDSTIASYFQDMV